MTDRLALFAKNEAERGTIREISDIVSVEDEGTNSIVLAEVGRNENNSLWPAVELIDELARRVEE